MRILRLFASTVLCILILFSSFSWAYTKHYCCGALKKTYLGLPSYACCPTDALDDTARLSVICCVDECFVALGHDAPVLKAKYLLPLLAFVKPARSLAYSILSLKPRALFVSWALIYPPKFLYAAWL